MSAQDTISQAILHMLRMHGRTQRALAAAMGCHPSALSLRLKGVTRWTASDLDAAAAFFDEPLVVFLTERRSHGGVVTSRYTHLSRWGYQIGELAPDRAA